MWADQGIKTPTEKKKKDLDPDNKYLRIDNAGWDGIVDSYRNPTRDYWETKAVYAPVFPEVDEISFTPGQASVRIPVQNNFDFTNLNTVSINWSVREDGQELASGVASIDGQPHTVSDFELPIEKLKTIQAGKPYYTWLIFTDSQNNEINRKAVELIPILKPVEAIHIVDKLSVIKGETVTVEAGDIRYVFNPVSGQFVSAELQSKQLITDIRPVIWRKPDLNEISIPGGKQVRDSDNLNHYTATAKTWDIRENNKEVVICSEVEYVVNEKNYFTMHYRYTVGSDGHLHIHYEILPEIEIPWLPVVGMAVTSVSSLDQLYWLGLGPHDAYPNKQSAPVLGLWGGKAGSKEVVGNKATRWVKRFGENEGFKIYSTGYLEHTAPSPETIHILSGVLGRPEKGRKADESVPQLLTDTGESFVGEFSIVLGLLKNNYGTIMKQER